MATTNHHFKVKHGLIVQGSSATVAGNQVLTEASSIGALADVNLDQLNDGDVLIYNSQTQSWIPGEQSGGGGGGSGASITVSDNAPLNASTGDLWYNSSIGSTYIFYDGFWVDTNPSLPGPQGIPGVDGIDGAQGPQGPQGPAGDIGYFGNIDGGRADTNYGGIMYIDGGSAVSF